MARCRRPNRPRHSGDERFRAGLGGSGGTPEDCPNVIFGLMNEPHEQSASEWLVGANAAIEAIRNAGARQLILVPGSYWTGAHSWTKTDNGKVMAGVVDPTNTSSMKCINISIATVLARSPRSSRAPARRGWSISQIGPQHHAKGFLGEMGWAATQEGKPRAAPLSPIWLTIAMCGAVGPIGRGLGGRVHVFGGIEQNRRSCANGYLNECQITRKDTNHMKQPHKRSPHQSRLGQERLKLYRGLAAHASPDD